MGGHTPTKDGTGWPEAISITSTTPASLPKAISLRLMFSITQAWF